MKKILLIIAAAFGLSGAALAESGVTPLGSASTGGANTWTQNQNFTGEIQSNGARVGYNLTATAVGTAYTLTATAAALDFGTTDPSITIDKAGTYLLLGGVNLKYTGATFVANRTVTAKFRRTNNTAADLGTALSLTTRIITTITDEMGTFDLFPVIYTTANTNDVITVFGDVSVLPTAGTLDASQAFILAIRIY